MNKIQKPLGYKIHKHSHEELYGKSNEVPAVFSYSVSLKFDKEVTDYKLQTCLIEWIESLKQWALQNKYFIGHIKIFAEGGKDFSLWLSTTGKEINIKGSKDDQNSNIKNVTINMTAIIFGIDEQTLRSITLEILDRELPSHSR